MLVEGVHFRRATAPLRFDRSQGARRPRSPTSRRWGPRPGEAYVALGIPRRPRRGRMPRALRRARRGRGGDRDGARRGRRQRLAGADARRHRRRPRRRAGARRVARRGAPRTRRSCVTGELGGAAAGLLLLERPELRVARSTTRRPPRWSRAQTDPTPRLGAGAALAAAGAAAMIDVSDGLGADAGHLARGQPALASDRARAACRSSPASLEVAAAAGRGRARPRRRGRRGLRAAWRRCRPSGSATPGGRAAGRR